EHPVLEFADLDQLILRALDLRAAGIAAAARRAELQHHGEVFLTVLLRSVGCALGEISDLAGHEVLLGIDAGAAVEAHAELIEAVLVPRREEMPVAARHRQPEVLRAALNAREQVLELQAAAAMRVYVMVPFDVVEPDNAHIILPWRSSGGP